MSNGVISRGVSAPLIREGDNITNIVVESILNATKIIDKDGKEKIIDVCDFGVNMDERIADGYYFAKSMKVLEYILDNPELLEERADARIKIDE